MRKVNWGYAVKVAGLLIFGGSIILGFLHVVSGLIRALKGL